MPANSTAGKYCIGQKINHWTLLEAPLNKRHCILCRCDCGNEVKTKAEHVISGDSTQCRSCASLVANLKHGAATRTKGKDRLYRIWTAMKMRCSPQEANLYTRKLYYENGVRVCEEWMSDYATFRDWSLVNGYQKHLTLDRWPDADGNYKPSNCRWATWGEQSRNHRDSVYLIAFGESRVLMDWADDVRCAVGYYGLLKRLRMGWPVELAILTPSSSRANYGRNKRFAALMGHSDGSMLAKVYSHVDKDEAHLKRILAD